MAVPALTIWCSTQGAFTVRAQVDGRLTSIEFKEGQDVKRGDVVVFKFPEDPGRDFIKRVIGLPGDTVAYRDNTVYVNGKPFAYRPVGSYIGKGQGSDQGTGGSSHLFSSVRFHGIAIHSIRATSRLASARASMSIPPTSFRTRPCVSCSRLARNVTTAVPKMRNSSSW